MALSLVACNSQILVGADLVATGSGFDAGQQTIAPVVDAGGGSPGSGIDASLGGDATLGADDGSPAAGDDGSPDDALVALVVPWSTSFESGFGDFYEPPNQGYCYVEGSATYAIVTSPVHTGQYAAAFTVDTAGSTLAIPSQARCVRQGVLPSSAYYGAWYFVPAAAASSGNWNLLHFQGGDGPDASDIHGLWDVSLTGPSTLLMTEAYDFLDARILDGGAAIPIGQWFHLEVFLKRAADGTGQFTLTQDGQVVATVSATETDDSQWGQWYVGNLAAILTPSTSTLYVDDVTIGNMPSQ